MALTQDGCTNTAAWNSFEGGLVGSKTFTFTTPTPTTSIAEKVLDTFNISYINSGGGTLYGVDIKQLDAMQAIKISLLEAYAQTGVYKEPIVNEYGEVEFIAIGDVTGNITDVYYTLQSAEYLNNVTGAIITGGKPLPERVLRDRKNLLEDALAFDSTGMMTTCNLPDFSSYYTITYDDPHTSSFANYNDGIETIYQDNNLDPFERVVGWVYDIDVSSTGDALPPYVSVSFNNTASVPIKISGDDIEYTAANAESIINDPPWNASIGTLLNRKPARSGDPNCWSDAGYSGNDYGDVDCDALTVLKFALDPKLRYENIRGCAKDKFLQVSKVWIVAAECDQVYAVPRDVSTAISADEEPSDDETIIFVSLSSMSPRIKQLNKGEHYGVGYNSETGEICFQFLANVRQNEYNVSYGENTSFYLDPACLYVRQQGFDTSNLGRTGTIIPTSGGKGYLVYQIWAQIDLETPSILIHSPAGNAEEYKDNLEVHIQAITVIDEPPPVAINGDLVDQTINYRDQDPTTVQDLEDTDYERKMKAIDYGEGVSLTISSLTENETATLSSNLHNLMEADSGVETVYTCGPTCRPQLGGRGNSGGIINNITYSYSDRGSYTISVNEGPMFIGGLSSISTGPHIKQVETISMQGTVVGDYGDGTMFKILLDGYGVRDAINCCPDVIRTGDKVSVTVHNNPVEA